MWRSFKSNVEFNVHSNNTRHSIGQFHQHFRCAFFANILLPKNSKPKWTREKLCEALLYEKHAYKMLMKLTPGVNFTNMLMYSFFTRADPKSIKRWSRQQYLFTHLGFARTKAVHKTLMKLTPEVGGRESKKVVSLLLLRLF